MLTARTLVTALVLTLAGCGGSAPAPAHSGATDVALGKDAPPAGYVEVTTLHAQSGKGCGLLGDSGSLEEAHAQLRNAAADAHASYVRITDEQVPRPNRECAEHEYKLTGVAYRNGAAPPTTPATAAPTPTPAPAAPTPLATAPNARVCIPGATQACLGPGACPGAQACRDDASGYLPCDCARPTPAP